MCKNDIIYRKKAKDESSETIYFLYGVQQTPVIKITLGDC